VKIHERKRRKQLQNQLKIVEMSRGERGWGEYIKRIVNGSEEIPMRKFDLNKFYAKDKLFFLVFIFRFDRKWGKC
jgi:hypothetical protein